MRKIMYHIILCSTSIFYKSAKFVFFANLQISVQRNRYSGKVKTTCPE
ncbi:hypothetical protein HMPREF6123_1880 [Oribacterium sinus F0268]|uniref:Uncharacterized protein n=1 Tax=Oribacterium sinus F0268 TaxID=585501 RepID=C2KZG1_9FIRM|nr:hypothetical protein HMPREF6123_1880 [Oribacterium sinus F0268]